MVSVVRPETVGADHLGKLVRFVSGRGIAASPQFREANPKPRFGKLPRCLASSQPASDDVNVELHCAAP
jgi:hypothetical protein